MRFWIDADACPNVVKAVVFKAAARLQVPTVLVANRTVTAPRSAWVSAVVVGRDVDEADRYIAGHAEPGDVVVTADIPLAAELVGQDVVAIDPRGKVYDARNVQEALATRDLMHDLREGGQMQGGPPPLGAADKARFANAFDREVTRLLRKRG